LKGHTLHLLAPATPVIGRLNPSKAAYVGYNLLRRCFFASSFFSATIEASSPLFVAIPPGTGRGLLANVNQVTVSLVEPDCQQQLFLALDSILGGA
jgi:hypothetical protein